MKLQRWLPYGKLTTEHLGLLLATARVIAWLGMLLIAFGIAAAISRFLFSSMVGVAIAGYGLAFLAFSGLLAAVVGIEESLRRNRGGE